MKSHKRWKNGSQLNISVAEKLVYQDDDADFHLVVDDVVYLSSDVDVLLDVHSDVVVHDDQLDVDDVLTFILDVTFCL